MQTEPLSDLEDYVMPDGYGTTIGKCLTYGEIEALLAAERERCAVAVANPKTVAEMWISRPIRDAIAAAIRNLPPETEGGPS